MKRGDVFVITGGPEREAFVAQRDAYRAEMCTCGHPRGEHMAGGVASCHRRCGCLSFELARSAS